MCLTIIGPNICGSCWLTSGSMSTSTLALTICSRSTLTCPVITCSIVSRFDVAIQRIIEDRNSSLVHDKHIKSNALPFYFKPAVLNPIYGFLFRICCSRYLTHFTDNYAAHMGSRDKMMPMHHLWFRPLPIGCHLIVNNGLFANNAFLRSCI